MRSQGWRVFGGVMALVVTGGLATSLLSLAGCGGEPASQPAAGPAAQGGVAPQVPGTAAQPMAAATLPRSTNTKWIGGIPYDVFYDRPLEIAANQTLLATPGAPQLPATGTPAPVKPVEPAPMPMPAPSAGVSEAGAPVDWVKVAPMEFVTAEVSELKNALQMKLNTLGDYNKSWEQIGVDATALAAIAGVIEQHPGEVSWKPNAKVARDLASQINANAAKTGNVAYRATKEPFDSLVDLLSGNPPAGVEAEANLPFGDYADRSVLMATIDSTLNYAKANINTQERLVEQTAEAKRKLTVLALLMAVVSTPSYSSTDEEGYQQISRSFINAAVTAREAVDAKDFNTFTTSLGELQKSCAECHTKYKD